MNSEKLTLNGRMQDDSPASSQFSSSDSNANLNTSTNQNKGAIPKTKTAKSISIPKKSIKLNNNVEDILIQKSPHDLTESVLHMHTDVLRLNGYTDQLSTISGNYLDDYKNVIYNNSSGTCKNCSASNKLNGTISQDIYNSSIEQPSYQPSTSNLKEIDIDLNFHLKLDTDSSSSDENDLLSISDDGCIYTYKGDHVADLPNSFFSLDIPRRRSPDVVLQNRQESGSPEMDFLEMDFDPGPSGDADSDSQSNADLESAENLPQDLACNAANEIEENQNYTSTSTDKSTSTTDKVVTQDQPELMPPPNSLQYNPSTLNSSKTCEKSSPFSSFTKKLQQIEMPWSCSFAHRTITNRNTHIIKRYHGLNGDLMSPSERIPSPNENFSIINNSIEYIESDKEIPEQVMIWSEQDAYKKQTTQISTSACGATAVLNVLNALRFPIPPIERLREAVKTNLRANSSPLAEYLLSRSVAGSTHKDLIEGLHNISEGQIYARFFHMFPERVVNIHKWLHFWITHGAVPIATLNLQQCTGSIPDAWHHQMIFGVGPRGIYMTNPLECVSAEQLWFQLCSESILLIRREDVLSRWNFKSDLKQLTQINDVRWRRINVVGQVANMIRESRREKRSGFSNTSHIKIPAAYSSGITLAMLRDAPLCPLLMFCPELPLLPSTDEATGYSDDIFY